VKITKNKKDARQRDVTITALGVKKYQLAQRVLNNHASITLKALNASEKKQFELFVGKINANS
jgi:DNA-binding MarR family transcriptional regulator